MTSSDLSDEERSRAIRRVLLLTLGANVFVALLKIAAGMYYNIVSLQADGFHSGFDGLSNVIGLVAIGIAARPPDREHPYGHQKLEVVASILIGVLVVLGMMEVGRGVYQSVTMESRARVEPLVYVFIVTSILISLSVSYYERRQGRLLNSMVLSSDAAHSFSDALGSLAVLIGCIAIAQGFAAADILASLVVMAFIGMTAYRVLKEGLDVVVDTAALDASRVRTMVEAHPEVRSCHYVRSRGLRNHLHLEFHMTLEPSMTLASAGAIMLQIKEELRVEFPAVADIVIQLEPHMEVHLEDVPDRLV